MDKIIKIIEEVDKIIEQSILAKIVFGITFFVGIYVILVMFLSI